MSVRSLSKLNKGNKIRLGSLKAIFVNVSQNFVKSHLKFCIISQISAHSLWHVCSNSELILHDREDCSKDRMGQNSDGHGQWPNMPTVKILKIGTP